MEQFSHDLTLALEETSRSSGRIGRWGMRRRTRSTGNLPCAPQPTEDSSSSPADPPNNSHGNSLTNHDGPSILASDSDDRHDFQLSLKSRTKPLIGNFESDSFNENFSPARPNTRRKRKFKRMAVEYETTPSTPGNVGTSLFPVTGAVKKRVIKHGQENYKGTVIFCGKRKRSHRDRYYDYDRQHSSSVPRQRDVFLPKASYLEYRNRTRTFSKPCERIMPLNKSIVSKIEKISQDTRYKLGFEFVPPTESKIPNNTTITQTSTKTEEKNILRAHQQDQNQRVAQKSGSFESTFNFQTYGSYVPRTDDNSKEGRKSKSRRRQEMMQLQFEDPAFMDCGPNEFSSSSSLSSDSEEIETNESDREGDDELTDWPGNEAMVNFASKHDFKRAKPPKPTKSNLPQIKSDEMGQDDDTLMSGDELNTTLLANQFGTPVIHPGFLSGAGNSNQPPSTLNLIKKNSPALGDAPESLTSEANDEENSKTMSLPIDIAAGKIKSDVYKQIESEMSGETSNHFYSSPNSVSFEPREIRAGCRRIKEERPGFSIISTVNEQIARFLQDGRQIQLRLVNANDGEIGNLAKLYSLNLETVDGSIILTKTSNTTQLTHVQQSKLNRKILSDFKRRCYGEDDETESTDMAS